MRLRSYSSAIHLQAVYWPGSEAEAQGGMNEFRSQGALASSGRTSLPFLNSVKGDFNAPRPSFLLFGPIAIECRDVIKSKGSIYPPSAGCL